MSTTPDTTAPATIKVSVNLTLEVDPAAWVAAYGIDPSEVRLDVRDYIKQHVWGSAAVQEGGIVRVTLR